MSEPERKFWIVSGIGVVLALVSAIVLACCGCDRPAAADWTSAASWDLACALLADGGLPAPSPQPAPGPDDGAGPGQVQGWFLSDAKALVAKGNALADRAKAILDRAEADGKVTVDVRLPGRSPAVTPPEKLTELDRQFLKRNHWRLSPGTCGMLGCEVHGGGWVEVEEAETEQAAETGGGCAGGVCRPRLFGRRR